MRGGKIKVQGSSYSKVDGNGNALHQNSKNMSIFEYFDQGCFFKRENHYCSNRLTDYYCVVWTNEVQPQLSTSENNASHVSIISECSGEFTSEPILYVNQFILPFIIIIGTFGNLITCYLASQIAGKQLPVCYYISLLAFLDLVILFIRGGDLWMQSMFEINLNFVFLLINKVNCQLSTAIYSFLMHFKSAVHIAMSIDIWRLIRKPTMTARVYTSDWIRNSIILTCVLLIPLNCQFVWTFDVVQQTAIKVTQTNCHCGFTIKWPVSEHFSSFIWPLIDHLIGDILPMFILTVTVIWSSVTLFVRRNSHITCVESHEQYDKEDDENVSEMPIKTALTASSSNSKVSMRNRCQIQKYILNVQIFYEFRNALLGVSALYIILTFPTMLHNLATYFHFARSQWIIIVTLFDKQENANSAYVSYKDYITKGKQLAPLSKEDGQVQRFLAKLMTLLQLIANTLVLFIFAKSFRKKYCEVCKTLFAVKLMKRAKWQRCPRVCANK